MVEDTTEKLRKGGDSKEDTHTDVVIYFWTERKEILLFNPQLLTDGLSIKDFIKKGLISFPVLAA